MNAADVYHKIQETQNWEQREGQSQIVSCHRLVIIWNWTIWNALKTHIKSEGIILAAPVHY